MTFPPSVLRVRVEGDGRRFRLWLPLFTLWPPVLLVFLLLSPLVIVAAAVLWPKGWGQDGVARGAARVPALLRPQGTGNQRPGRLRARTGHSSIEAREADKLVDDQRKILDMLAEGKIGVDDAERLLKAVSSRSNAAPSAATGTPKPVSVWRSALSRRSKAASPTNAKTRSRSASRPGSLWTSTRAVWRSASALPARSGSVRRRAARPGSRTKSASTATRSECPPGRSRGSCCSGS